MLTELRGVELTPINSWGDGTQGTSTLIQSGLFEPGEAKVLGLAEAPLFCME